MKKLKIILCVLACLLGMTACASSKEDGANTYSIYYLSNSETKVETHEYTMQSEGQTEQVDEMLLVLQINPTSLQYKAPLAMGFQLVDYKVAAGKVTLNVNEEYKNLTATQEVLVRAAIVKNLTQIPGINFVSINVDGAPLRDATDKIVGWMNRDQFLENEGSSFNTYKTVTLKLYFADEKGTGLMETTRTKEYSSNVSMEKLIVEELIKGPNAAGIFATINPQTKVANVIVQDGICYVNLDESFLTQVPNVTAEVTIYSIVNSLVQFKNVNKVQISINGDSNLIYRDKFNLADYYEGNEALIVNDKY